MSNKACCTVPEETKAVADYSQTCTRFVEALRFEDIPQRSIDQAKTCLFDWLGCVIKGASRPHADPAKNYVAHNLSAEQAGMVGQDRKASITDAAFFNGYCGHIMEMDDVSAATSSATKKRMAMSPPAGIWPNT